MNDFSLRDPIVVDPPNFDFVAAWAPCREEQKNVIDAYGEVNWGAAFGADPGCTSCPACRASYWAWGNIQRCIDCGFEYPTGWRSRVREGQDDRGTLEYAVVAPSRPACPYYMHGWRNPTLGHDDWDVTDWRAIVASFVPWLPTPEETAAIAEAVHGDCKHYRGTREGTCAAGVRLRPLVGGDDYGWCTRLPCLESFRNRLNGPTASCELFVVPTPAEEAEERAEIEAVVAMVNRLGPLQSQIKRENRGRSAHGVAECPICKGALHWSHAGYNGHVHMGCETENCVSIVE